MLQGYNIVSPRKVRLAQWHTFIRIRLSWDVIVMVVALQVNLTDGRLVQLGCVNTTSGQTGCNPGQLDVGIRKASFRFAPGETVTEMALFAGPDNTGKPNARAGAIRFATSLVRPLTSLCNKATSCCPIPGKARSTCKIQFICLPPSLAHGTCSAHI